MVAAEKGHEGTVKLLLAASASVDLKDAVYAVSCIFLNCGVFNVLFWLLFDRKERRR
jgi:hypothetical protein